MFLVYAFLAAAFICFILGTALDSFRLVALGLTFQVAFAAALLVKG